MKSGRETNELINITGIDKAELVAALYNRAKPLNNGFADYRPGDMSVEEARDIIAARNGNASFDYLYGRVMKVDLNGDTFIPWGYNEDNKPITARQVVNSLRARLGIPENTSEKSPSAVEKPPSAAPTWAETHLEFFSNPYAPSSRVSDILDRYFRGKEGFLVDAYNGWSQITNLKTKEKFVFGHQISEDKKNIPVDEDGMFKLIKEIEFGRPRDISLQTPKHGQPRLS